MRIVVLNETAMAAAGQGNILASRLTHRAHVEPGWFLYAPACALVEADRRRARTPEPGVTVRHESGPDVRCGHYRAGLGMAALFAVTSP